VLVAIEEREVKFELTATTLMMGYFAKFLSLSQIKEKKKNIHNCAKQELIVSELFSFKQHQ